ncbi:MAG TPA: Ig-like domain-containing protein, partial [Mycobacteriales bacterium]|nr:Ig-like domain-containing protein [Mycobacteriales bacterium]
MNASTFRRRFSLVFAALTLTPLLASGAPVSMDFKVLIDSDNKEATGCTVVTTAGLMKGVDHVLTTSVSFDSAAGAGTVTGVTRQVCTSSVLNTFSAPIPVNNLPADTTGWPVGVGPGGTLTIETHIPTAALGGVTNMHLGFTAVSGNLVDGVILDDDGTKIIWPPLPGVRRHAVGLATTRVITLDGADGEWFPIAPIAEGSSSASPLLRFFSMRTYMNASDLFFDITAQSNKNAPTANDDTYSVERGKSLGVNVPGVLSNDTDPNGKPLTAILISGSGTHHGALTLNADGSFSYINDGSPAPSDSFEYKANNGSADSNTAHVDINITEPNAGPPPVKPAFTSANQTCFTVGTF